MSSFSYNPDLESPLDMVRFKIGDTIERAPLFSNEEIQAIYSKNHNVVISAAVELMQALVTRYARMTTIRADDVSKEAGKLYTQYKEQLAILIGEQEATTMGGSTIGGQLGSANPCLPRFVSRDCAPPDCGVPPDCVPRVRR